MTQKSNHKNLATANKSEGKKLELLPSTMENSKHISDKLYKAAKDCVGMCSDNLCACIESGSKSTHALQNMNNEMMECCNRTFNDISELSKEALECRSMNDMVGIYNKIMDYTSDNYFKTANKMSEMFYDYCMLAYEPFIRNTVVATKSTPKVLAA